MRVVFTASVLLVLAACADNAHVPVAAGTGPDPALPAPARSSTINVAAAHRFDDDEFPNPAPGLQVTAFARSLDHPRWLHVLPNGDVLVAETNAQPKPTEGLRGVLHEAGDDHGRRRGAERRPHHAAARRGPRRRGGDPDGPARRPAPRPSAWRWSATRSTSPTPTRCCASPTRPARPGSPPPATRVAALPAGEINHHWTKGLAASPDGRTLYVSVGSNSDHGENGMPAEAGRAAIWAIDPATGATEVYAAGLRNPVGLDFEPRSGTLWTVVNERDELGGDLVPDYLTSVRRRRLLRLALQLLRRPPRSPRDRRSAPTSWRRRIVPDYALGAHRAPLGLAFADGAELGPRFREGAFVGAARIVEPQAAERLQGGLRALPQRPPVRRADRRAHRLPRRRRRGARPPGRRGARPATAGCWWRTTSATRSGA